MNITLYLRVALPTFFNNNNNNNKVAMWHSFMSATIKKHILAGVLPRSECNN